MTFWPTGDPYAVFDEDDESSDGCSSSEDEIDIILHGTPEQKRKLKRLQDRQIADRLDSKKDESSSEDDFEKELNAELAQRITTLEKDRAQDSHLNLLASQSTGAQSNEKMELGDKENAFYDDIYFDSDEEDNDDRLQGQSEYGKHAVISNDDLLYDPTMDDKDQKWVDKQRRRNNNTMLDTLLAQSKKKGKKPAKLPGSDALLDCPACLTTLCIDCQRHETYRHQYRAMFVMNCEVDTTQMLQCPEQQTKGKKKKKNAAKPDTAESGPPVPDASLNTDLFNPVKCTECSTVVGVIDKDEVYHFFNVLSSHT